MGDNDRKLFHEYIFSKDGYLTPQRWENKEIPIASLQNPIDIDYWSLKVFKEDNFSSTNFSSSDWITYHEPSKRFFIHGPGMEYMKSYTNAKGLIRGRIYMGIVSTYSYVKPDENDSQAYEKYKDKYKQLVNFYRSCCRYIKKNFRKDDVGFYHGTESDELERNGIEKLQFNL
jgi:hypothetical protein